MEIEDHQHGSPETWSIPFALRKIPDASMRQDISGELPPYEAGYLSVPMDPLMAAYPKTEEAIRKALQEYRGNRSVLSTMLNTLLLYTDHPYVNRNARYYQRGGGGSASKTLQADSGFNFQRTAEPRCAYPWVYQEGPRWLRKRISRIQAGESNLNRAKLRPWRLFTQIPPGEALSNPNTPSQSRLGRSSQVGVL